jgi:hypothetical protein
VGGVARDTKLNREVALKIVPDVIARSIHLSNRTGIYRFKHVVGADAIAHTRQFSIQAARPFGPHLCGAHQIGQRLIKVHGSSVCSEERFHLRPEAIILSGRGGNEGSALGWRSLDGSLKQCFDSLPPIGFTHGIPRNRVHL